MLQALHKCDTQCEIDTTGVTKVSHSPGGEVLVAAGGVEDPIGSGQVAAVVHLGRVGLEPLVVVVILVRVREVHH